MTDPVRCPSAQPGQGEARVLGLVVPTPEGDRVAYLNADLPASPDLLGRVPPPLVGAVLRLSARCEASRCLHYEGGACHLARRVAARLAPVTDRLPPCTIRRTCRWHAQEGPAVCLRCPQVTTSVRGDEPLAAVALPPAEPAAAPA